MAKSVAMQQETELRNAALDSAALRPSLFLEAAGKGLFKKLLNRQSSNQNELRGSFDPRDEASRQVGCQDLPEEVADFIVPLKKVHTRRIQYILRSIICSCDIIHRRKANLAQ